MASKQAITLVYSGRFHVKRWGAQPKFCVTIRFLALKPCLIFFWWKKTISSIDFFWLFCISEWIFLSYIFPSFLIFWGSSCGCSWCWPFLETCMDMFHGHNIHFVGRGKKVVSIFYKKEVLFFKKEKKRENTKKREKKPKVSFLESYTHSILKIDLIIIKS